MKKRILMLFMALMLGVTGSYMGQPAVHAEAQEEDVDLSFLLTDDAIIGYMTESTRGVYLLGGYSVIDNAGGGKIVATGGTDAAMNCTVGVTVILEKKTSSGTWKQVTSFSNSKENTDSVMAVRMVTVGGNNYYRVRSIHTANTDTGNSKTEVLFVD